MANHSRMMEHLELRRMLAAQAYDWNSVTIKGNGFLDGIVYASASGASGIAYTHTDIGGAYRLDPTTNRWTPLNDWIQINDAMQNNGAQTMAVDPTDPNRVYMVSGTYQSNAAFLRSSDQGRTWQRTDVSTIKVDGNGWGRNVGQRLMVDPNSPNILYYGAQDYSSTARGLWKSTDYGATWNQVSSFTTYGDVWNSSYSNANGVGIDFVLFDKNSATAGNPTQTIYAGVATVVNNSTKVFRSTNGGTSWAAIPNQPTTTLTPNRAVLTPDGSTMYVAYSKESGPYANSATAGALYKVTNPNSATPTWTLVTPSAGAYCAVAIDPATPTTIYAAVFDRYPDNIYRSTNSGSSWTALNPVSHLDNSSAFYANSQSTHWLTDLEINPFNHDQAMFNTGYGIFRTTNLTAATPTWAFYNDGLEESAAEELASPSSGSLHLLSAMGDRGGFRHVDFTVSPAIGSHGQNNGLNVGSDDDIDVAATDPNYVVRVVRTTPYVQFSVNGGVNWSWFPSANVSGDGSDDGNVAISADGTKAVFEPSGSGTLLRSSRTGSTWSTWTAPASNTPGNTSKVVADLVDPQTFYAYSGSTVSRSTDGGVNWTVMTSSAPSVNGDFHTDWVRAVPGQTGHLLVSRRGGGLSRSTNGGANWTQISSGTVTTANQVGVGMAKPGNSYPAVYVGGTVGGLNGFFRCDDITAGTPVWTMISDLSHNYGYVTVIQGDPQIYGRLYVGSNGRGILYADIHNSPASLPGGWSTQDIGSVGTAGSAGESSGTYDIVGSGTGITGTSDQFRFAYQSLTGDGAITARVMGVPVGSPNNYNARAGVMIRSTSANNSSNAFVALTPGSVSGAVFTTRATTGATTNTIASATTGVWPPYWVRILRIGNSFSAYTSPDGVNWTQLGTSQSLTMGSTVNIGLGVTSSNNNQVDISTFQNVSMVAAPAATIGVVSPDPRTTGVSGFTITFDQPVSGFDLGDVTLSRDGGSVSLGGATLNTSDGGITWTLSGTSGMTDEVGSYMLSVVAASSGIVNGAGVPIGVNESEGWAMNGLMGSGSDDQIRLVVNGATTEYRLGGVLQYTINTALLPTLLVFGFGGNDTLTVDYSSGEPVACGATFDGGANSDTIAIIGSGGGDAVTFDSSAVALGAAMQHTSVENFTFNDGGGAADLSIDTVKVASATATLPLNSLTITNGGTLDVGTGAAIVYDGDVGSLSGSLYTGLTGLIASGRNGATWTGPGITSSAAAGHLNYYAVAISTAKHALGLDPGETTIWRGQQVDDTDVLIRYTYGGDGNLDGKLDIDDYGRIDTNIVFPPELRALSFANGDFNYDGKVDVDDYGIIDVNIVIQGVPL